MATKDRTKLCRLRRSWCKKLWRRRRAASPASSATGPAANAPSSELQIVAAEFHTEATPADQVIPIAASEIPIQASPNDPKPEPAATELNPDARPADRVIPIAAPETPSQASPNEPEPKPTTIATTERSNPALSISQELWNAAYSRLEVSDAKLVKSYVKILEKELEDQTDGSSTIAMEDAGQREKQLRELIAKGQEKTSKVNARTQKLGEIVDYTLSTKGVVDLVIKAVPQAAPAALPWAGVCLALQMLKKPGEVVKSIRTGIEHVNSRMDWYCASVKYLLNKDNIGHHDFQEIMDQLKLNVIALYTAILSYQMKSICSYYHQQTSEFFRNMFVSNDWRGDLRLVTDAEDTLRADADQYYKEQTKFFMRTLGNTIMEFTSGQKNIQRDQNESALYRDLRVIDPQHDMERIEKNKDELLDDAYQWVFDTKEYATFADWEHSGLDCSARQLLWIQGPAGTGKTMLMIGLIRHFSQQSAATSPPVSFFFCQNTDDDLKTATAVLRSLVWLLLLQQPHLISHLLEKHKVSGASLFQDKNAFFALSTVLLDMLKDSRLPSVYLAVDALDECSLDEQENIIGFISKSLKVSRKVKWLLSSRPEVRCPADIENFMCCIELDETNLEHPVKAYIQYKLHSLEKEKGYSIEIADKIKEVVYRKAGNTFLWVALVLKYLSKEDDDGSYAIDLIEQVPPGLFELYNHMLDRIEQNHKLLSQDCKKILKVAYLALRPLRFSELAKFADLLPSRVVSAVGKCGSFVTTNGETVNLIHLSAKEYLEVRYKAEGAQGHMEIAKRSLHAISLVERNMCGLTYDSRPEGMTTLDQGELPELRYSVTYWINHLLASKKDSEYLEMLSTFLDKDFLHWLEILSLSGVVRDGVIAFRKLLQFARSQKAMDGLLERLLDAYNFASSHEKTIEQAPLQTYNSALLFSPTRSKVREQYWEDWPSFIEMAAGKLDCWGEEHQFPGQHTGSIYAIVFSPNGKTIATGSDDKTVRIWSADTGEHLKTLEGHTATFGNIKFSPNGNIIASSSMNETVRLWSVDTGKQLQVLKHNGIIVIAFSPDSKTLASGSIDKTVRIWSVDTGKQLQVLKHNDGIIVIAFSPDSKTLASGSAARTVRIWSVDTGKQLQVLEGHTDSLQTVVFSPNGKTLASGSVDKTVRIWSVDTGTQLQVLEHTRVIMAMAFSPDGKVFASGTENADVVFWSVDKYYFLVCFISPNAGPLVHQRFISVRIANIYLLEKVVSPLVICSRKEVQLWTMAKPPIYCRMGLYPRLIDRYPLDTESIGAG
ncbi:hypothetical protein F4808DRAFT_381284 [Astrocystis sublimbata]|nr:hypothetical protein F4808DRAFT_381284 [Astrocystis sublimbata]